MNKKDLVAKVARDVGLSKVTAEAAVESVLHGVFQTLKEGGLVTLVGFGSFTIAGRPSQKVARFKAGKALKDALN